MAHFGAPLRPRKHDALPFQEVVGLEEVEGARRFIPQSLRATVAVSKLTQLAMQMRRGLSLIVRVAFCAINVLSALVCRVALRVVKRLIAASSGRLQMALLQIWARATTGFSKTLGNAGVV